MDTRTGNVYKDYQSAVAAGANANDLVSVTAGEMTADQLKRFLGDSQPVVLRNDRRSKLAKKCSNHSERTSNQRKRDRKRRK